MGIKKIFNFYMPPIRIVRIRTIKNPRSRKAGTPLCMGEIHPLKIGIGLGRAPKFTAWHFADWAKTNWSIDHDSTI